MKGAGDLFHMTEPITSGRPKAKPQSLGVKTAKRSPAPLSAQQLDVIIDGRGQQMAKLTKAVLAKLRPRFPGAVELVYDKANSLVIGFCPNERASDVINSIATYTKWINLYFFEGDALPDPEGLLQGTGSMVRSIKVTSAADLDRPAVKALMTEALKRAEPPLDKRGKRRILLRQARKQR